MCQKSANSFLKKETSFDPQSVNENEQELSK